MGGIPDGHPGRRSWRLHAARGHATQLFARNDDGRCTRSETQGRGRSVPGGLDGVGRSCKRQPGAHRRLGSRRRPWFQVFSHSPGHRWLHHGQRAAAPRGLAACRADRLAAAGSCGVAGPVDVATQRLAHADWSKYETYLQSRPDEAELSAIQLMISLCREYHFRLHIVHLATSRALDMLHSAKSEGLPVSVETCPHYLHLASEKIPDGQTLFKCRSEEHTSELQS